MKANEYYSIQVNYYNAGHAKYLKQAKEKALEYAEIWGYIDSDITISKGNVTYRSWNGGKTYTKFTDISKKLKKEKK